MKNFSEINRALAAKTTKLFTLLLAVAASVGTMFASVTIDGIAYNLNETELTAEVTGGSYSGNIDLPESVLYDTKTYSVTSIGDYAFYNCTSLTSVTIPNSVTSIGEFAFGGCSGLISVTVPNSVTSIEMGAFFNCTSLTSVTIPNSVTSIEMGVFYGCTGLTSVSIPNSVTSIGESAFEGCSGLTSVHVSDLAAWCAISFSFDSNPLSYAKNLYLNDELITDLVIPDNVQSIGDGAFEGCSGLTSVTIPNSVTSIGESAFEGCSGLTWVTLNSNAIVSKNYSSGSNIAAIFGGQVKTYYIGENVTSIGNDAFYGCSGLTSVVIPNSVISIGSEAFRKCTALTSLTIGNSVTNIGIDAFSNCSGLTSLTIPNSVTSIGGSAFGACTGLTSVTIGCGVTSIGMGAFGECSGLVSVEWNAINCSDFSDGQRAPFSYAACYQITSFTLGDAVEHIPAYLCSYMNQLTSVTIPNSVTSIGKNAFYRCSGLTSVTIPNGVTSIGNYAFDGCTGLTSVEWIATNCSDFSSESRSPFYSSCSQITSFTLGDAVEHIPAYLCSGMSQLTSVTIPNSVTSIGTRAFKSCSSLTSIEIPNSVTSIVSNAFSDCIGLTDIYATCGDLERIKQLLNNDNRVKYKPLPYTITANAVNGSVSTPQNICDALELTVVPDYGYHFTQWSDGVTDNPRTIELTQDTTFTAEFAKNKYSISVTCDNTQGSIEGESGEFDYLTEKTYNAIPNYGYHFVRWSDNDMQNPRTYTITADATLTAIFAKNTYTITKNAEHGTISGNSSANYLDEVTLTVTPDYGYHFTQWSDGVTDNPRAFILTQDTAFTAEFAPNKYSISVTCDDTQGSIEGESGEFDYLTEKTYNAVPNYGYHFNHWQNTSSDIPDDALTVSQAIQLTLSLGENESTTQKYKVYGYITSNYASYYNSYYMSDTPGGESVFIIWRASNSAQIGDFVIADGYFTNYHNTPEMAQGGTITKLNTGYYDNPLTLAITQDINLEAIFAKNTYNITKNAEHGTISGNSSAEYLDEVTLTVNPDYGYHFTQWSDGVSDNPREFILTQDTAFTAEFAVDKSGSCGDDLALRWEYDSQAKTLTISGNGTLNTNYTFGVEAPTSVEKLVIAEGVTTIGNSAFAGYSTLKHISIPSSVKTIYEQAFYNCTGIQEIFSYRITPSTAYSNTFDGIEKFECVLHVLSASIDMYKAATGWRDFYYVQAIDAEEVTETLTTVSVTPSDNEVVVTWPTSENASAYILEITKDGVVFCTLVFNENGQLTGINFAPGRDGNARQVPTAIKTSNGGFRFTVTGLESSTDYHLTLNAKDSEEQVIATYTADFTTTGVATSIDQIDSSSLQRDDKGRLILRNGQILILRGDKIYTMQGAEVL